MNQVGSLAVLHVTFHKTIYFLNVICRVLFLNSLWGQPTLSVSSHLSLRISHQNKSHLTNNIIPHFSPTPPFSVTCFGNFSSQSSLHSFIFPFPFTVTPSTSSLHSPKNSWYLKNIFIDKQTSKTLKFYQRRSFSSLSEDV